MFDTIAEADQKLTSTIILHKDVPVIVGGARGRDGKVTLTYREFNTDKWNEESINSDSFNVHKLGAKLGYINTVVDGFLCTVYSRRIPVRKSHQTQGLSNVNVQINTSDSVIKVLGKSPGTQVFSFEKRGLLQTMNKDFPSLVKLRLGASKSAFIECAFDKHLALSKEYDDLWKLKYKNQEIGWTNDLDQFRIDKEWDYLGELFEETHMKVRH